MQIDLLNIILVCIKNIFSCNYGAYNKIGKFYILLYTKILFFYACRQLTILETDQYTKDGIATKITEQYCLEKIYFHLAKDYLTESFAITTLRNDIKLGIKGILGLDNEPQHEIGLQKYEMKKRCGLCLRNIDKKKRSGCSAYLRPICCDHRIECAGFYK